MVREGSLKEELHPNHLEVDRKEMVEEASLADHHKEQDSHLEQEENLLGLGDMHLGITLEAVDKVQAVEDMRLHRVEAYLDLASLEQACVELHE